MTFYSQQFTRRQVAWWRRSTNDDDNVHVLVCSGVQEYVASYDRYKKYKYEATQRNIPLFVCLRRVQSEDWAADSSWIVQASTQHISILLYVSLNCCSNRCGITMDSFVLQDYLDSNVTFDPPLWFEDPAKVLESISENDLSEFKNFPI